MSDEDNPEDSSHSGHPGHSISSGVPTIDYSIPGMRIQLGEPGSPWPLVVRTAAQQPEWVAEPQGAAERVSLMVTPTTILYHGAYYRIHEAEETASGWIYRMQPCPEGETLHQVIELERSVRQQAAAEKKEFQTIQRRSHNSAAYEILLGWLPACWQEELSQRWHFSPADATRKNGLALFFLGLGGVFPAMRLLGSGCIFVFYLAADGAIRWMYGFAGERACGVLPLELAAWLVRCAVRPFRRK